MPRRTPSKFKSAETKSEESNSPQDRTLFQLSLDTSNVILSTLRDVGRVTPVPYLYEAAQLTLGILSTVQAMKDCDEGFERLARDSCGLVYAVCCRRPEGAVISEEFSGHIDQLVRDLESISQFAKKRLKSKRVLKFIRSNSDRGKIHEYREAIRQSLDVFSIQSSISGHQSMSRIERRQEDIALQQRERDSGNRLLLEELLRAIYSEETLPHHLAQSSTNPSEQPPVQPPAQSPSPTSTDQSKNPFRNPDLQRPRPSHIDTPQPPAGSWGASSNYGAYYRIAGNYVFEDRSQHIKNTASNNTTSTYIVGSNNISRFRGFSW
ncbi:hypothetical protein BDZ94DRAFT_64939 [Collybia nuda]|uniref:Uncharacterized protein n=1 Tax=Collybia nuda TaxID=64659 RepID=A0A9P5XW56_9AGAR|nr:hypothetical protein BDZ94DRAFT_64939 [Collybia nuda]